jgi:transcriptional regulator with XRE-family HTH domain
MLRQTLLDNLKDATYRHAFVSAQVRRTVTAQIREMRKAEGRNWTQADLGHRADMKANAISRLESPNYGDYSANTLLRLAEAFDVGLIIRFAPISELVEWNQTISEDSYTPPSYSHDRRLYSFPAHSGIVCAASQSAFYRPPHSAYRASFELVDSSIITKWKLATVHEETGEYYGQKPRAFSASAQPTTRH